MAAERSEPEITDEQIARRAFELWLTNGASPEENWAQAEAELRREALEAERQRRN
ncbi:MAG TPA: DUF2934 domain-containing protein [Gaiellaceae bacterium]|nr:DUF2934 domain-containing protein [Gaiellaceae bacterium]